MAYLTISLTDNAKAYIDEQIASGRYTTADELLSALIEQEQEQQSKRKINSMLRSSIQKGNAIEATDEWWETQREQLPQPFSSQP
jgi:antitoxin ParD1/3/4